MIVIVRVVSGFNRKNPKVGNLDWEVIAQDRHGNTPRSFILRNKDERFRKESIALCKAMLMVYFGDDLKTLQGPGDSCTFGDRGFFSKFPVEHWR